MKQLLVIAYLFLVVWVAQAYNVSSLNYDPNGNIQFLERKDLDGATKHHLQYNYQGIDNQLTSVTNYGTYAYDVIGRLETATKVGESPIDYGYNSDGLLATITAPSTQVHFAYDEAYRIKKQNYQTGQVTWYVRDINGNLLAIYSNATTQKEVPLYGSNRVGLYQRQGRVYRYELKDHLGNVRVVINKTGTEAPLVETTKDYYPFGSLLRQAGIGYRYGYQGDYAEDETDEFGLNSFMLRYYDPVLGRWLTPDPYNEFHSPYLAMGNNPIALNDPTGGETQTDFVNKETNETVHVEDGMNQIVWVNPADWNFVLSANSTQVWTQDFTERYFDIIDRGYVSMESDLGQLSRVLFAEIRGGKTEEINAIGNIVRNRVESSKFPNSYKGVITQRWQFSSLNNGDPNQKVYKDPYSITSNPIAAAAWLKVLGIANGVVCGNSCDPTDFSLLYYSPRSMVPSGSEPNWNFKLLNEVSVSGVRSNYLKMYNYK